MNEMEQKLREYSDALTIEALAQISLDFGIQEHEKNIQQIYNHYKEAKIKVLELQCELNSLRHFQEVKQK